jgi:monovalent cation/hydrogen antiporter
MALFEIVVGLLLVGVVLALYADRIGAPYPALLALAGAALALVPGTPQVTLDPELALALFVAPVLLDAAYDASPRDLKQNLRAVSSLAITAVLVTIVAVAVVAHRIMPAMSWAAAIALGAIVAPPDASAASAVLRKLKPPHRVLVILEGESLFNDATALIVYRLAVGAALTGTVAGWTVVPMLLLTAGGGVIAGYVLARFYLKIAVRVEDIPISVMLQFIGTFGVWILAERVGLSPIVTMVAFAMTAARSAPAWIGARRRIASYAVWEVAVLVLNVLAFVLIGLQLRGIGMRFAATAWHPAALCAAAVCVTVVVVRIAWVTGVTSVMRFRARRSSSQRASERHPGIGASLVISWSGMRGIVTLATALALAEGFPFRDLIVLSAFCVVLVTLVVQGLTLRPLMTLLGLEDDGSVERELALARTETSRAAIRALEAETDGPYARTLKREYETRIRWQKARGDFSENAAGIATLQRRAVAAQRQALIRLRAENVIGDDAFHVIEEEIDLLELSADPRVRPDPEAIEDDRGAVDRG